MLFKNLETKTKETDGDKNTSPDTNFVKVVSYLKWVLTSVENLKKLSSERVQLVLIYWQYIHLDTKNFFRASAERIQPVSIYWRIIPSSKKPPEGFPQPRWHQCRGLLMITSWILF